MTGLIDQFYRDRIADLHRQLGIADDYAECHKLGLQPEATAVVSIGLDMFGRERFLTQDAASAWLRMQQAAANDGVVLQVVSAFRDVAYQAMLLQKKLDHGQTMAEILQASAAPGYSEHHTGRALDLSTPGYDVLEECFEDSPAFAWLQAHAADYGFYLSYARDNCHGITYEPWHWCWRDGAG